MKYKIARYYVSPHLNRYGRVARNGWDVRKVVIGEDGIEREGAFVNTFPNKKEAKEYCEGQNKYIGRTISSSVSQLDSNTTSTAKSEPEHAANTSKEKMIMSHEPTNADRCKWAMAAVQVFADATGLDVEDDGLETAITDLLADLLHLCDKNSLQLSDLMASAERHYTAERFGN